MRIFSLLSMWVRLIVDNFRVYDEMNNSASRPRATSRTRPTAPPMKHDRSNELTHDSLSLMMITYRRVSLTSLYLPRMI